MRGSEKHARLNSVVGPGAISYDVVVMSDRSDSDTDAAGDDGLPGAQTSYHVRLAVRGHEQSFEWVVRRFTPLLLSQASYRMGTALCRLHDPEDVVNDVWVISMPKLGSLDPRNERYTPVLMRFLSTTLIQHVNNLMRKHFRRRKLIGPEVDAGASTASDPLAALPSSSTTTLSRVLREERKDAVGQALDQLSERDRELIVLHGMEGQPYRQIAGQLGREPGSLAVEYQRALAKLRARLPSSVFDEFDGE